MPRETARRSPCSSASYSASLFETSNSIWNTYLSCSPVGLMKSMKGYEVGYASDKQKFPPNKLEKLLL
jgi:hypothetical protein